jgi:hypothetical protein
MKRCFLWWERRSNNKRRLMTNSLFILCSHKNSIRASVRLTALARNIASIQKKFYILTYIHIYIHAYTHTHTHTRTHTRLWEACRRFFNRTFLLVKVPVFISNALRSVPRVHLSISHRSQNKQGLLLYYWMYSRDVACWLCGKQCVFKYNSG